MTIQEKNPQRGQRGGGGRLTPVTSLQAAARGETGLSLQPTGHRGHQLSWCPLMPPCAVSLVRAIVLCSLSAWPELPQPQARRAVRGLSLAPGRQAVITAITPQYALWELFRPRGQLAPTAAESFPCPQGRRSRIGEGMLSGSCLHAPAQIVPTRG